MFLLCICCFIKTILVQLLFVHTCFSACLSIQGCETALLYGMDASGWLDALAAWGTGDNGDTGITSSSGHDDNVIPNNSDLVKEEVACHDVPASQPGEHNL